MGARPPTDEMRASLAAVRAARDAAQVRLRRDTRRVRLVTVMFLAAFSAGVLAVAGHLRKRHRSAAKAPAAAISASPAAAAPAPPEAAPAAIASAPNLVPAPAGAADAVSAPGPAAATDAEFAAALATCAEAYEDHVWPVAIDTCARAAEMRPRDPAVAMKVAQAFHARARYADAGVWARRALALDGVDPEALVILAHAERRAGHPAAAKSAYRRYLVLAPHGWHAAEARAAVRASERASSERPRTRASSPTAASSESYASSASSNADAR